MTKIARILAKAVAVVLSVLLLFCGCTYNAANPTDTEINTADNTKTTADKADTTQETTETAEKTDESVSFSTPAGAVIIGKVGRDADGWYITPEQPLNIELTYFADNPLYFTELTRINMFESSDDGIDKSIYLSETVTVTGDLRIYRDYTDKLYIFPYTISIGKTAEKCCAVPDLTPPESVDLYDPSIPLPEKMQITTPNGKYTYNPYVLSIEILQSLGNGFADFYVDFVDAFLSYGTTVPCNNKEYAEMLSTVLFYEFPLFAADCSYQYAYDYNGTDGTITLRYSASEAEHYELIEQFISAANEYLESADETQSDIQKAKNIYHSLSSSVDYDYIALATRENTESYNAYINKSGICSTFAITYSQLLSQVGIESTVASGTVKNNEGHAWTMITVDGCNYFCDPTYECGTNDGIGYVYFGLNYEDRIKDGTGKNGITVGKLIIRDASEIAFPDNSL